MPTLAELAALIGGTVEGPATLDVTSLASVDEAGPAALTFITDDFYLPRLAASRAAAVLLGATTPAHGKPALRAANPRLALSVLLRRFAPVPPVSSGPPIDPTARVHPGASVSPQARIGAYVVIEEGASVGAGTVIGHHGVIGWGASVGRDCRLHPLVTVGERCVVGDRALLHAGTVLGVEGFGFEAGPDGPVRIPQIGRVVLENDVETGGNAVVDRGMIGDTVLRQGVKLGDLVHIAHNCDIGAGSMITALVGIAGSVTMGRNCVMGGQSAISDHVTIGNRVQIGGASGVNRDAADGEILFGLPARPAREAFRMNAALARLPKLLERVRALEKRIAELTAKGPAGG